MMLIIMLAVTVRVAVSDPTGSTISNNSTENGPARTPSSHTAARGTITTMLLSAIQQDQQWKAYVGNVTGTLTLDDAGNNTIYDWTVTTVSGEVYAANASLDFSSVGCAQAAHITAQNNFHNMTGSQADSVNRTFNATAHAGFVVAGVTIPQNNCSSTALWVNDTKQTQSATALFQEVLLVENTGSVVYTSLINDDKTGFDNSTYDFQLIVPESDVRATPTTYYFYVELDG